MPLLTIIKTYANNTRPTKTQLDKIINSLQLFFNQTGIDSDNIQTGAITSSLLDSNSVSNSNFAAGAITVAKLAADILAKVMPTGAIIEYPTSSAVPTGWLLCNGQAVSRATYSTLFGIIGETWGEGNNTTTFNVPDMQGLTPVGNPNTFASGYNSGYQQITKGSTGTMSGGDNVGALSYGSMQTHTHPYTMVTTTVSSTAALGAARGAETATISAGSITGDATYGTLKSSPWESRAKNKTTNFIIKT